MPLDPVIPPPFVPITPVLKPGPTVPWIPTEIIKTKIGPTQIVNQTITASVDKISISLPALNIPGQAPIQIPPLILDPNFRVEAGYFVSPNVPCYSRVIFKTNFLRAPAVVPAGELRGGKLTPPQFRAPQIQVPGVPEIKLSLPSAPVFEPIKVEPIELPDIPSLALAVKIPLEDTTRDKAFWDARWQQLRDAYWNSFTSVGGGMWNLPGFSSIAAFFADRYADSRCGEEERTWNTYVKPMRDGYNAALTALMNTINGEPDGHGGYKEGSLNYTLWKIRDSFIDIKNKFYSGQIDFRNAILGKETPVGSGKYVGGINGAIQNMILQYNTWRTQIEALPVDINESITAQITLIQDNLNRIAADITSAVNNGISSLYALTGVPDGIFLTPMSPHTVSKTYFDVLTAPGVTYYYVAIGV